MIENFDLHSFHFLRPDWLYALLPLALILYLMLHRAVGSYSWKKICDDRLLPHILISKFKKSSRLPVVLTSIATLLCVIAAAGPVWKKLPTPVFRDHSSLVIVVDLSQSMDASDIKPSRLKRAKLKLIDILQQRKGGQTALVVYAANAFTVTPLTTDTSTIANLISALETEMMPAQGSNAADALKLAMTLLNQSGTTDGDVLLISDGISNQDYAVISELANKGHRLSILGVGTKNGGPIALDGGFLQDDKGAIVIPKLDNQSLQKAALAGHGLYVNIQTNDDDVNSLSVLFSAKKAQTETAEAELTADIWNEEGPWLLLIALPLVALLSRRGLLILVVAIISPIPQPAYALDMDELWLNSEQRAMRHFENGEHEKAAGLFNNENWKASAYYRKGDYEKAIEALEKTDPDHANNEQSNMEPDSDALYNKANALANLQRYEESVDAYDEAIKLDPNNEDAIYNREQVKKQLQQQQSQQGDENKDQDKNEQNKDKENKQDQQASDKEGEKSEDEQSQDGQQAEQDSDQENQDQSEKESAEQSAKNQNNEDRQQAEPQQKEKEDKQDEEDKETQSASLQQKESIESSEEKKATEQWLRRIVDDPGGLLRRKFKYQYQNMPGQKQSKQPW